MELGLNDFLAELGRDTVSRLNRESKAREIPGVKQVKEEKKIEMPQPRQQKIEPKQEVEPLDEDFVETALDFASVIIKTVKSNFESSNERRKVFESIRSAINLYLDEQPRYNSPQPKQTTSFSTPVEMPLQDYTGQVIETQYPMGGIDNKLNIGIKVDERGNKEADISSLTEQEKYNLRVLSGIEEIKNG